jgi:hypothetical protein
MKTMNFTQYHTYVIFRGIPPKNNKTQQSKQETDPKMNKQKQLYVLKIICSEKTEGTFRIGMVQIYDVMNNLPWSFDFPLLKV